MNIKSNFTYNGNQPNFTRDIYQTKADMAAAKATRLPQMYVASCLEDGNIYVYNKANSLLELSDGSWLKCTDSELQRSDDNGESWTAVYSTGVFQNLQEVGGGVVLAGSDNSNESGEHGILRSEDYGKTWTKTRTDSTWKFRRPFELGGKTVVLALAYALDSNGTDYSLVSEDGGKPGNLSAA